MSQTVAFDQLYYADQFPLFSLPYFNTVYARLLTLLTLDLDQILKV